MDCVAIDTMITSANKNDWNVNLKITVRESEF